MSRFCAPIVVQNTCLSAAVTTLGFTVLNFSHTVSFKSVLHNTDRKLSGERTGGNIRQDNGNAAISILPICHVTLQSCAPRHDYLGA